MIPKSLVSRALPYLRTYGFKQFLLRLREVLGAYILGAVLPILNSCEKLPVTSQASKVSDGLLDNLPEILFLGVLEWNYRFQRPQQLCLALTRAGCRVHYCAPTTMPSWGNGWHMLPLGQTSRLWQVRFLTRKIHIITRQNFVSTTCAESLQKLIDMLKHHSKPVIIVEHPYWIAALKSIKNAQIIYDCLDDCTDFSNANQDISACEKELVALSAAVVSTSQYLAKRWQKRSIAQTIIRNACDYDHFSKPPKQLYPVPKNKPVIGYHGAIEDWFDVELVEALSCACPDCTLLLVGGGDERLRRRLKRLPNTILTGEVPYARLPHYLHTFNIGILPFLIRPLTLGVNPVKVYEYLATGLPVVSVPLPEMEQFGDLVHTAVGDTFVQTVIHLLQQNEQHCESHKNKRRNFALTQSWDARAREYIQLCNEL